MERMEEGRIQQLRGRLRTMWGNVTDDDVDKAEGNFDRLVGIVKEKTGEAEETIRERLEQVGKEGGETSERGSN
jgi:uncharacterized protein YjbJ (UPF0337 family)